MPAPSFFARLRCTVKKPVSAAAAMHKTLAMHKNPATPVFIYEIE